MFIICSERLAKVQDTAKSTIGWVIFRKSFAEDDTVDNYKL